LLIEAKPELRPDVLANLNKFILRDGESVNAEIILNSPNISLYCLDDTNQRAIFVELPPDVDLSTAPFVYVILHEQAERLIAVPYEAFRQLTYRLPKVERLIMIYISGRSGSTLLSSVFNQLDGVLSLSEPDVATQFAYLRPADGSRDAELGDLLDCTLRFLFRPTPFSSATVAVLKLRIEGLQVMDLVQAVFPQAKNLFSYRDAMGFVASFYRVFQGIKSPEYRPFEQYVETFSFGSRNFKHLAFCLDPNTEQISTIQQLTLWWIGSMEWYLEQYARSIPILAVRYADLNTAREPVLTKIFAYCGLPVEKVPETLAAFSRDSQEGTFLARENPAEGNRLRLTPPQIDEITRILARHPMIKQSDFFAPGTLTV
jgi:hypothetical protein